MNNNFQKELLKMIDKYTNIKELKKYQPIMIHLPAGLCRYALEISDYLTKEGIKNLIYANEAFGSCDLPINDAKRYKCKGILHFAHSPFLKENPIENIKVFYIPVFIEYKAQEVCEKIIKISKENKFKKISLHAHIQYVHKLPEIAKNLLKEGIEVVLRKSPLQQYKGQILGCETLSVKKALKENIDAIVYLGEGNFHAIGIMKLFPEVPIIVYDFIDDSIKMIPKKKIEDFKKKYVMKYMKIRYAHKIGILTTTKIGQYKRFGKMLEEVIKDFKKQNKKIYVFVAEKIDAQQLEGFAENIDAFINLACPRLEDDKIFHKPIMSYITYKNIEKEINGLKK